MTTTESNLDVFQQHRGLLFGAAYRLLGSAADAEDVVQETWLRFAEVPLEEVREPRAYLLRTVTNLALNQIRTQQRRREEYVGPWLPEPVSSLPNTAVSPAPDEAAVLADDVSLAMLVVLEQLSPWSAPPISWARSSVIRRRKSPAHWTALRPRCGN